MSGKNHKKLRRLALDRKSTKQGSLLKNPLVLLTRTQLFQVLELLHLKWVRQEREGWEVVVSESLSKLESITGSRDSLYKKIVHFQPSTHLRTEYPAIPISIFHKDGTEEVLFTFTSNLEFMKLTSGYTRVSKDEAKEVIEEFPCPKTFMGITPFNSFRLPLDLHHLQQIIPHSRPDLDQLIVLGQLDESFSPLTKQEMKPFLRLRQQNPDIWRRMYTEEVMVVTTSKGTFYQPQKTRIAWSQNVHSEPVKFQFRNGSTGVLLRSYKNSSLFDIFQ
jgi:hypothetical protein